MVEKLEAKEKCVKVIESCVTYEHFITAVKIIDLFYDKFKSVSGYNELYQRLIDKRTGMGIYLEKNER